MSPKFGKKSKQERPETQAPEATPAPAEKATTESAPETAGGSSWFGLPDGADEPAGESLPPVDVAAAAAPPAPRPQARAAESEPHLDREPPVDREPEPVPVITTPQEAIRALADGRHQQPHDLLGHHLEPQGLVVRAYRPFASSVAVIFADGERVEMQHESDGVWGGVRLGRPRPRTTGCGSRTRTASSTSRTTRTGSPRPSGRSTCT